MGRNWLYEKTVQLNVEGIMAMGADSFYARMGKRPP
jgi:hypothetical protein